MPVFKVAWSELYDFEALVAADNLDHAIRLVKDDPSLYADPSDGVYIDGTLEINHTVTQFMNTENGVRDEYRN